MSTHQLDRRRVRPVGRRMDTRRIGMWCAAVVGVFAITFGIGHIRRGGETFAERTPPRLAPVSSPVPAALASAPAIKLAVVRRPPPAPKQSTPVGSQTTATPTVTPTTPAASSPTVTSPAPVTPAPTPTPTPAPSAPTHSSGGSGGSSSGGGGSGGGGSGTSFESSG